MIFTIEEINKDNSLLPNITLGYRVLDNCASSTLTVRAALAILNGLEASNSTCSSSTPAVVTSDSVEMSRMVGPFGIPLVSYTSTCTCLSNKKEFPTFSRTIPSDSHQAKFLALLVKRFGWTWIGAIQSGNQYGMFGIQAFTKEVVKYGVCLAFTENILSTYSRTKILQLVDIIKKSTVKVILAFASERDLYPLMQEIVRQNITGIQWIASEDWVTAARPSTEEIFKSFGGTIGLATRKMAIPKFKDFLFNIRPTLDSANTLNNAFWEYIFGCTLNLTEESFKQNVSETKSKICTGKERLDEIENAFFDVTQLRLAYNVYKAVYAIVHALHDLLFCAKEKGTTVLCGDVSRIEPWQVTKHLKRVNFVNRFGEAVYFDENGDPPAAYDIINWQLNKGVVSHVTVGHFDTSPDGGSQLVIDEDSIVWSTGRKVPAGVCSESCPPGTRRAARKGQPICCFDCIPCADGTIANTTVNGDLTCKMLEHFGTTGLFKNGQLLIGGVFPVFTKEENVYVSFETRPQQAKCVGFDLRAFRWTQAMIFTIEEINKDNSLLPNITLGYRVLDNCASSTLTVRAALAILNGLEASNSTCSSSTPAVVTSNSVDISRVVGPFGIPLVSYTSTCTCLSNKKEFPTFSRTIPSDSHQAKFLALLVKRFGWTWIGAIHSDNSYGKFGVQSFTKEVVKYGVCIAFTENILSTYSRTKILQLVDIIKKSTVKVILAFASERDLYPLMQEIVRQNITGIQWIASEDWVTAARPSTQEIFKSFGGTIGLATRKMAIPKFKDFLFNIRPTLDSANTLNNAFWEYIFGCSLNLTEESFKQNVSETKSKICTGKERLDEIENAFFDVTQLRLAYNVYKAVYAIVHALHDLLFCAKEKSTTVLCGDVSRIEPWQVTKHLKRVNFVNRFGEAVYFDENGDPPAAYDIINWQLNKGVVSHVTVGHFDTSPDGGSQLVIDEDSIVWSTGRKVPAGVCSESCPPGTRRAARKGQPICCFDCIPCADGTIANTTGAAECINCPQDYWSNDGKDSCILRDIEYFSYYDAMGITFTTVSLFGLCLTVATISVFFSFRSTPIVKANNSELSSLLLFSLLLCFLCPLTFIGQPTAWSCMLRHTAFGITFALCISCVLGKTIVVVTAFRATLPNDNMAKKFGPVQQRIIVCSCTAVQVVICVLWLSLKPPFPDKNFKLSNKKIILECNTGSEIAFYAVLGYIGLLAATCLVLAFLARKLPDNFNEAKLITFSMLIFCAVWVTFIPAYVSSPGKYTVAVEIFAIFSSTFGLLLCIFAPKCYIILLKPEKNTKKHIMGKIPSKRL
ncbi:vomeronasal type-2 receptor 1-like isoform X4 [Lepisosteus oculatus]